MHEKLERLFAQKSQRQNKLPLPLLSLLPQILFNVKFRAYPNIYNQHINKSNCYF